MSKTVGIPRFDRPASRSKKIGFLRWCIVRKAHYEALTKAERALRESEARYHTTLISIGDGIITTNADGRGVREGLVVGLANHTLLIARDGTEHAVADSGAAVRNEAGEIMGVVLVFRDPTAARAALSA